MNSKLKEIFSVPTAIAALAGLCLGVPLYLKYQNASQASAMANPSISAKVDRLYNFYLNHTQIKGGSVVFVPESELEYKKMSESLGYVPGQKVYQVEVFGNVPMYFSLVYTSDKGNPLSYKDKNGDGINKFDEQSGGAANEEYKQHLDNLWAIISRRYSAAFITGERKFPRSY